MEQKILCEFQRFILTAVEIGMTTPTRPITPSQTSPATPKSYVAKVPLSPSFTKTTEVELRGFNKSPTKIRPDDEFRSTIKQLLQEEDKRQDEMAKLMSENEKLEKLVMSLCATQKRLKDESDEQGKTVELKVSLMRTLENEVTMHTKRNEHLENEVQKLRDERTKLKIECTNMKSKLSDYEVRQEKMAMEKKVLEAQIREMKYINEEKVTENELLRLSSEQERLETVEEQKQELEAELQNTTRKHITAMEAVVKEKVDILNKAEAERRRTKELLDRQRAEHEKVVATLIRQNKDLTMDNVSLQRDVDSVKHALSDSRRQHETTKLRHDSLESELKRKYSDSELIEKYRLLKKLKENQDKILMERFKRIGELGYQQNALHASIKRYEDGVDEMSRIVNSDIHTYEQKLSHVATLTDMLRDDA
jgi:chromosome segregation ATPase